MVGQPVPPVFRTHADFRAGSLLKTCCYILPVLRHPISPSRIIGKSHIIDEDVGSAGSWLDSKRKLNCLARRKRIPSCEEVVMAIRLPAVFDSYDIRQYCAVRNV